MSAIPAAIPSSALGRTLRATFPAVRATAQWTLYFGISFSITAGFLVLAHV
ncbi:MAG: hypothetical protein WDN25_29035 [Acetobacteraceae bacterium]